jgi:phosphatidylserine/phosphatidylglycerophosphate/cardiolipin synthase-like enzyme
MLPLAPRLIVEPDEGVNPILGFINSAESSLLIKQFTFTEVNLIAAVIEKKKAGVDVQVMLNAHGRAVIARTTRHSSSSATLEWPFNGRIPNFT